VALKALGVSCLVAESFARIFFRNAINLGLPALTSGEAAEALQDGDEVLIDLDSGVIENLSRPYRGTAPALPDFLTEIIEAGGMTAHVREKMRNKKARQDRGEG
jgi:3-isopropylmalate/(R)-2-methylmalate dehydratase small subunit